MPNNARAWLSLAVMTAAALSGCGGLTATIDASNAAPPVSAAAVPAPDAAWYPSPNFNARPAGMAIDTILLHHTASAGNAESTARYFANPAAQVSSHYIVDRDGSIIRCVQDVDRAWHAGVSEFDGRPNVNNYSIGIEICNVGDNIEPYPNAQVYATMRLSAYLVEEYGIPLSHITRHRDVALPPGRKTDTSNNFPLAYYLAGVQDLVEGMPVPARIQPLAPPGYDPSVRLYTVKPGDTWQIIADGQLDNAARAGDLELANPGVTLTPGTTIHLPTNYEGFFQLHPMSASTVLGLFWPAA